MNVDFVPFILIFIAVYLSFRIGSSWGRFTAAHEVSNEQIPVKNLETMQIYVTKVGDFMYVYRDGIFLYQSKSSTDIEQWLVGRFPNTVFVADPDSIKTLRDNAV